MRHNLPAGQAEKAGQFSFRVHLFYLHKAGEHPSRVDAIQSANYNPRINEACCRIASPPGHLQSALIWAGDYCTRPKKSINAVFWTVGI